MKFIAFIPARSGSKSITDKNLSVISGKPLIIRSVDAALSSKAVDDVIFSSDSETYINLIQDYCKDVNIHYRPPNLAGDNSKVEDCVLHFINSSTDKLQNNDVILLIEPTSPFIAAEHINSLRNLYTVNDKAFAAQTVTKFTATNNPDTRLSWDLEKNVLERIVDHKQKKNKNVYYRFGNLCSAKVGYIKEGNKFLQSGGCCIEIPQKYGVNIDSLFELEVAQAIAPYFGALSNG